MNRASTKPFIEKLNASHKLNSFDCGVAELNDFLIKYALQSQKAGSVNTYVAHYDHDNIIGYYSLAVGSVIHQEVPVRVKKGLARHPIPVMLLARLAVSVTQQTQGIGKGLLKDALLRTAQAADIAGIRALLVHAKNDNVKEWYKQFNFDTSPTDSLHLYLLLKDIKKIVP